MYFYQEEPRQELPVSQVYPQRFWLRRALTVMFVIVGIFGTKLLFSHFFPAHASNDPLEYDPVTLEPKPPSGLFRKIGHFVFSGDVTLQGEREDRVNILLLGIGGDGHEGPYLSDSIILASIKPSTKEVALISIPRDLQVEIPSRGKYKINHANAFGEVERPNWGGARATEVVEKTFDISVPYYIRVDFRAFRDVIDTVGGISVAVERSFTDPLYPAPENAYQTVSFAKGVQTMDGRTALQFARSRHGSNGEASDFARARRQQKVLLALRDALISRETLTNPIRMKDVMDSLEHHMTTNMEFSELLALVKLGRTLDTDRMRTLVFDTSEKGYLDSTTDTDNGFVLIPRAKTFAPLHDAIMNIFDTTVTTVASATAPSIKDMAQPSSVPAAGIEIQNGTWRAGLAARVKKRLTDADIAVETIGNTVVRPQSTSGIYALKNSTPGEALRSIQKILEIPIKEKPPEGVEANINATILVVLGEDIEE